MAHASPPAHVLALNSGSSSLKFGLYRMQQGVVDCLLRGEAESIGGAASNLRAQDAQGHDLPREASPIADQRAAVARIGKLLDAQGLAPPSAIGHRIVHGGPHLPDHCIIDAAVLRHLANAAVFAPLHAQPALDVIGYAMSHFPQLPQVACMDTCFHTRMPAVASTLALPAALRSHGIRRYGFHGLSCESILRQLSGALPARLIIAHLGNGASVTAVRDGASIDTSMGLTPTGGLIMGTRSGDLDPGVLIHLMREGKFSAAQIEDLVARQSGLLGLSGISGDMRSLHQAATSNAGARLAIDMFCYAAAKTIGAMSVALDGADMIVFTGGIGENDAQARSGICGHLAVLGVVLDETRNRDPDGQPGTPISSTGSRCAVTVLRSDEDQEIARHAWALGLDGVAAKHLT